MTRHSQKRSRSASTEVTAKSQPVPLKSGANAGLWASGIFAVCMLAYLASGQSQPGNDATGNVHLPLRLLEHGTLFFDVEDAPKMFFFAVETPEGKKTARISDWRMSYQGQSAREAYDQGIIRLHEPKYYLAPTRHPGKYANTFGLGAGLAALPVVAPVRALVSDLGAKPGLLWWLGKISAALSVAGAVLFLFFAAVRTMSPRAAALLALTYGLATCAYSISSQALWQHGPCELCLAMGAYFLLKKSGTRDAFLCGLGFALAVSCRPTAALVVACVAVHLLLTDRRRLAWFVLGGTPVAVLLLVYSVYAFGSPFSFGQLGVGAAVAQAKTGQPGLWQTPLWLGMAGLVVSPSRGLIVYTPLALFAFWGAARAFRDPSWKELRPLAVAALLMLGLASKWFDWWGGACFAYRPIVDIVILLAFLSFPVAKAVAASRPWKLAFSGVLAYSFAVQLLGVFVHDVSSWNSRRVWDVVSAAGAERRTFSDRQAAYRFARDKGGQVETRIMTVDKPEYRFRLWSFTDSPLVYYVSNLSESMEARQKTAAQFLINDG